MKKTMLLFAAAALLLPVSACSSRFEELARISSPEASAVPVEKMSLAEAEKIINETLSAPPPAGHQPRHPGFTYIGTQTTDVKLCRHVKSGYCLVEVMAGKKAYLKFYVVDKQTGEKFAAAVWRIRQEYRKK